jgi:peptide/nickel transport system substrate-binding protein
MRNRPLRLSLVVALVFVVAAIAACGQQPKESQPPKQQVSSKQGGTITYGLYQQPETLDPHVTGQAVTGRIILNVIESLLSTDPKGTIVPGLATEYSVNANATEYTFKLRKDAKFHDGDPFNAEAVKFNFERIVDPKTKSQSAISSLGPYLRTDVIDPYTVKVVFKEPYALFLTNVTGTTLGMVSPKAAKALGQDLGKKPVGTGPFRFVEWVQGDHVTLEGNPDYKWAPPTAKHQGPAYLDKLIFKFVLESQVRAGALQSGELTGAEEIPTQYVKQLQGNQNFSVRIETFLGSPRRFPINVKKPPTNDLKVRQAILYSTDRKQIVDTLFQGLFPVGYGPLSRNMWSYNPAVEKAYPYDAKKAGEILDQAGWIMGKDGIRYNKKNEPLRIGIYTQAGLSSHEDLSQMVQAQLKKTGFKAEIVAQARPAWYQSLTNGDHNMAPMALWGTDPNTLYSLYHSSQLVGGFNWSHYSDPEFDRITDEAQKVPDRAKRTELYMRAQEIAYIRDAAELPVHENVSITAFSSRVDGLTFDSNTNPVFYDVYLKPK